VTAFSLRSERLVIEALGPADAEAFSRLVTRPEVGRMLFVFGPHYSAAEAVDLIARQADPDTRPLRLAIRNAPGGPLLGTIGIGAGDLPDIYYFLDPAVAGQGMMGEVLGLFVPEVIARFGVRGLGAKVFTDNPASARVLERHGFRQIGTDSVKPAQRPDAAPVWVYRLDVGSPN